jgi:hypothetical protein
MTPSRLMNSCTRMVPISVSLPSVSGPALQTMRRAGIHRSQPAEPSSSGSPDRYQIAGRGRPRHRRGPCMAPGTVGGHAWHSTSGGSVPSDGDHRTAAGAAEPCSHRSRLPQRPAEHNRAQLSNPRTRTVTVGDRPPNGARRTLPPLCVAVARGRSWRQTVQIGHSVRPRAGQTGIAGYILGLTAVVQVSRGSPGGRWIVTGAAAWTWPWTRSGGCAPG